MRINSLSGGYIMEKPIVLVIMDGVGKGDGVLKLGVGEIDNVFLPDLCRGGFYGLSVERVDGGGPWRG